MSPHDMRAASAAAPSGDLIDMRKSLVMFAGVLLAGCTMGGSKPATTPAPPAPKTEYGTWGLDLAARDTSVKPGDNFFMYANGTWYKNAGIPADRSSTGSFQTLRITSERRMIEIAGTLGAKP